jgi:MscS family membrane protein
MICARFLVLLGVLLAGAPAGPARAAEPGAATPPPQAEPPPVEDPFDRGDPQDAMRGYLTACRDGDFQRASEYLDLHALPEAQRAARGPTLAQQLKVALDRTLWVDLDALSQDPQGSMQDGLPPDRERVGTIETRHGKVPIYLQRVSRADGVRIWKISASTVDRIPELYAQYGYGPLEELLPEWMLQPILFELSVWSWSALIALVLLAAGLSWVVVLALDLLVRPLAGRTSTDVDDRLVKATAGPLRLAAAIGLFHLGRLALRLPVPVASFLGEAESALAIVAVAWFGLRLVDLFTLVAVRRLREKGLASALGVVPIGQKVVKGFVLAVAAIALLDSFGFNVTALLAGLGVGGIAVALAAQKTLENLFGGVTLFADRPVAVGDFCRFGDRVGTVEEIGIRSTRIRTLDRTLVTIPNAEFSAMQIENFTARDKIWYHPTLGLRYETTPEQLRWILVEVREMLYAHPKVDPDPARIRFTAFGAFSLDLEIFAYVRTRDFGEYLEIAEDLNLRLMDIVAASGTGFAFPSQTLYLGRDDGLDEKRSEQAEQEVRAWRERGELFLPRFPADRIASLAGTLDWPPKGSPAARGESAGRSS